MKTDFFILTATMSSATIDKWNKLETLIGHRCDSIEDFVEGIHRIVVAEQQAKQNVLALQDSLHQQEIITLRQQLVEKDSQINTSNQQLEASNRENESLRNALEKNKAILTQTMNQLIDNMNYLENAKLKGLTADTILAVQQDTMDSVLSLVDIKPINEIGKRFDSKFQYAEEIENTEDPLKDGIVAETISIGYRQNQVCIKPQRVVVYKYKK